MTTVKRMNERRWASAVGMFCWRVIRFLIIFGLAFLILKPFIEKIMMGFMSPDDLLDSTVWMIPRHPSVYYWQVALDNLQLASAGVRTLLMSVAVGLIQTLACAWVGYGLARFRFKGRGFLRVMVIVIMLIPPQVYRIAQYMQFHFFTPLDINLIDTLWPLFIMAFCGLGLKEGLYIYLLTTLFEGLPKDLENAAYIDGASPIRTYFSVILPNARTMMATVFLFSFCWQWTDVSYPQQYLTNTQLLSTIIPNIWIRVGIAADMMGSKIARNAACILVLIPLIILFMFCQKLLIKSIATSGQAN